MSAKQHCRRWRERLTPYLLGELPPGEDVTVRDHLEHCAGCRAYAKGLASTLDLLRGALAAPVPVPAALAPERVAGIRTARPVPARSPVRVIGLRLAQAAALALLTLGILAALLPALSSPRFAAKSAPDRTIIAKLSGNAASGLGLDLEKRRNAGWYEDSEDAPAAEAMPESPPTGGEERFYARRPVTRPGDEQRATATTALPAEAPAGSSAPALGDIPVTGRLFESEQRARGDIGVVGGGQGFGYKGGAAKETESLGRFRDVDAVKSIEDSKTPLKLPKSTPRPVRSPGPAIAHGLFAGRGGAGAAPDIDRSEGGEVGGFDDPRRSRRAGASYDRAAITLETDDWSARSIGGTASGTETTYVDANGHVSSHDRPVDRGTTVSGGIVQNGLSPRVPDVAAPVVRGQKTELSLNRRIRSGTEVAQAPGSVITGLAPAPEPPPPPPPALTPPAKPGSGEKYQIEWAAQGGAKAKDYGTEMTADDARRAGLASARNGEREGRPADVAGKLVRRELDRLSEAQRAEESNKRLPERKAELKRDRIDHEEIVDELRKKVNAPEPMEPTQPTFAPAGFNPFVDAAVNAFSTFSIDVDTASYALARRYLAEGQRPPPESVRTEEFVNFFDYDYPPPSAGTFAVYTTWADAPFRPGVQLLKIGVKGRRIGRDQERSSVLTLVIDTSGSMNTPDRLGLIRKSLRLLVDAMAPQDSIAIVQFDSRARLLLDHTPVAQKEKILAAVDALSTAGSTHLEQGLTLGYQVAAAAYRSGAANRVLLMSDGVANLGSATADTILSDVEAYRRQGIYCSVFGFGTGTYNDVMLERLADHGDGQYVFIDSLAEARRVLVDNLAATLHTIARDVKIQVQFDPARVARYRQVGYENRALTREQFRDDSVDAGEVGSGQSVTALYEVELRPTPAVASAPLATVRVRYRDVDSGKIEEIERRVDDTKRCLRREDLPFDFRLAAGVAEFAELLRLSPYTAGTDFNEVADFLRPLALARPLDGRLQELLRLVQTARRLPPP